MIETLVGFYADSDQRQLCCSMDTRSCILWFSDAAAEPGLRTVPWPMLPLDQPSSKPLQIVGYATSNLSASITAAFPTSEF
jgi:hypothetical protein